MQKWLKIPLYLLFIFIWLVAMLFLPTAVTLARRGEINIRNTRIFLITERDSTGVGFQSTTPASNDDACSITRVRYVIWDGDSEEALSACTCQDGIERTPVRRQCRAP